MRILDTFCSAGGASKGYNDAGFEVVGVDIAPQKHYPYEFHQGNAIEFIIKHGHEFDAIHASPPCQAYTPAGQQWRKGGKVYQDMVAITRYVLIKSGKPWIIENVPGAPLINPLILNGAFFGMRVRRTRLFETSFQIPFFLIPKEGKSNFRMGRAVKEGDTIVPVGHFTNVEYARKEMRIDWMNRSELAQAIPPAYTQFIGTHLMNLLELNIDIEREAE